MRCHVHGRFAHAGIPVDFSISLNAITVEAAELYVCDLFQGPYARLVIGLEITEVDVDDQARSS